MNKLANIRFSFVVLFFLSYLVYGEEVVACGTTVSLLNEGNSATVSCPSGVITDITFASYGTPTGSCGNFAIGECHASSSLSVVLAACLGKSSCTMLSHNDVFGDPCYGTAKRLYIQATCGSNACPVNMLKKSYGESDASSYDELPVESLRQKKAYYYNAKGQVIGTVGESIKGKTPRYLVMKDKTAVYNEPRNENSELDKLETQTTHCYKNVRGEWVCIDDSQLSVLRKGIDDECGKQGVDYGVIENGKRVGGVTCSEIDVITSKYHELKPCPNNPSKLQADFEYTIATKLTRNEIFYVKKGYVYSDGYIADKDDETAMHFHEQGHKKYNNCLKFPKITKRISGCYCQNEIDYMIEQERKEFERKHKNMLDNMADEFHKKYGDTGYDKTYECP